MTHDERVTGLLEANNKMVEMCRAYKAQLRKAHSKFMFYAAEHTKKADALEAGIKAVPAWETVSQVAVEQMNASRAKAVANEVMALEIEVVLAQY